MDTPRLTGSQRAYLFRQDSFLAGIAERAASLYDDGYDAEATRETHVFRVLCPENGTGVRPSYRVDPFQGTCTCPFYAGQGIQPLTGDGTRVPCKHLAGLPGLVHATCRAHVRHGRLGRYYRLWVQWRKASALRPELQARWLALGPVRPGVPNGAPGPRQHSARRTESDRRIETATRKENAPCTGTTSPSA